MTKPNKYSEIVALLRKKYGISFFERGEDPFYVLISTVLSQRANDKTTYRISPILFGQFSTPKQFVAAKTSAIEKIIKPIGFYKTKAKRIKEISKIIVDKFDGKVPENLESLMSLPGVGRKTANCVLVYAFHKPAIPVDVHVHRISNRIGLVKTDKPEQTEQELMKIFKKKEWIIINELLVKHGQQTCKPVKPLCLEIPSSCPLVKMCDYFKNNAN
ncbi:MAG: endonuclease III [Nanoarchaeota archaeon]|nr:endonuclease III [Nanoarchaeota archaeon]